MSYLTKLVNAQGLLLAPHLRVTPGGSQGTIWEVGEQPRLAMCKESTLSTCCTISQASNCFSFSCLGYINDAQELLLFFYSEITLGGTRGTIWYTEI